MLALLLFGIAWGAPAQGEPLREEQVRQAIAMSERVQIQVALSAL
jgi:hypothetical protein